MAEYGKPEYWELRYTQKKSQYDWYHDFSLLKDFIVPAIPSSESKILMAGCGSSKISEELFN